MNVTRLTLHLTITALGLNTCAPKTLKIENVDR